MKKAIETPPTATELPVLTAEEKINLLTLHRNALAAQSQKFQAEQQFNHAVGELNQAAQSVMAKHGVGTIPKLEFNLDQLQFSFSE